MMSDPVWLRDGLRFACTGCGDCCSGAPGAVWLNSQEVAALAQHLTLEPDQFERQYTRRLGLRLALHERPGGDCCFYDPEDKRCVVYEARPTQCRTYPFWDVHVASADAWESVRRECEGARDPMADVVPLAVVLERCAQLRAARERD